MPDFIEHSTLTNCPPRRPHEPLPAPRPYIQFDHLPAMHASQTTNDVMGSKDLRPVMGTPLGTRFYWLGWSVVLGILAAVVALAVTGVWPAVGR